MKPKTIRWSCLLLPLAVLSLATACHKNNPASATVSHPSSSSGAAFPGAQPPAGPLTVSAITVGKSLRSDQRVSDAVGSFGPKDTVYVSVETTGAAKNAKLVARWSYDGPNGKQKVEEQSSTISPNADAVTEFHISKPEGLAAGNYDIEILLNGKQVSTKNFQVG
jgi:hypothetical protein